MTLSQADFAFVSALVRREAAIVLAPGKEYLVEARLIPVARQVGAASVTDFLANLQRKPNPADQRRIIDALTTNETSWFRDREPFTALTDVVLGIGGLEQAGVKGFFITMSLTQDFLAPVPLGSWLEAEVELLRRTRTTMFVQGVFKVRGEPVLRSSGVFRLPRPEG